MQEGPPRGAVGWRIMHAAVCIGAIMQKSRCGHSPDCADLSSGNQSVMPILMQSGAVNCNKNTTNQCLKILVVLALLELEGYTENGEPSGYRKS